MVYLITMRVIALVFAITYFVRAVNRDNFKTCQSSSFCVRQRKMTSDSITYFIEPDSIIVGTSGITAYLSRTGTNQSLTLNVSYLRFATFRILIDDPKSHPSRYRLSTDDSLKGEPERMPINVVKSDNHVSLIGSANDKAVITLNPFNIDMLLDNVIVSQMNRRSLFNFETPRDHVEHPDPHSVTEDGSLSTGVQSDEAVISTSASPSDIDEAISKPQHHGDKNDFIEAVPIEESEELPDVSNDKNVTVDDAKEVIEESAHSPSFPWAEHFKEHMDRRPNGPMSLSMDIDFPSFSHLYGIPEHADSFVLKSTTGGDPYRLYNLDVFQYELYNPMALYGSVPVLWALNENFTVGIFWHNPSETWVEIDYTDRRTRSFLSKLPRLFTRAPERYANTRWISETGVLDVFVMLGRNPNQISKAYAHLTGTTPLPPLFAMAYHQSRWNYKDEHDVFSVDHGFDEYGIPLDVIWLDIEHTNGKRYFSWDAAKFPSPGEMVDKLSVKGRKLVTVVDPHMKQDNEWSLFKEGQEHNYYVKTYDGYDFIGWCWPGSSAWPDFTSAKVRQWWAEKFLTYEPVRVDTMFTWNDMGEPSVFSGPEVTIHKDTVHEGGREHRDLHNIYGLHVHRATWEGQLLRSDGKERPFVLTRAFFAGSQRTAAVWTGDNTANWEHLKISTAMLLSLSLTGLTLCGADVGGFFDNTEPELSVRWFQAAAYQPFFRAHKHIDTKRHEPWTLPEEHLNIVREAIIERYQLLPYWYTTFARTEVDGQPVMAPVWYHFRNQPSTFDLEHEYMIGEAILVSPVSESGATQTKVYFPPGIWYHHRTLETYDGNQEVSIPVNLSTIPVFYRGGWIIPRRERVRRSSWLMRHDPFTLVVLIDPKHNQSIGYLYDDDYHSIARETARFYRLEFHTTTDHVGHGVIGGRFRAVRIPIPGTTDVSTDDALQGFRVPQIERIVFVGLAHPIERATIIHTTGERNNVEFTQIPTKLADRRYMGTRSSGVVVVRCSGLALTSDWQLHLVSEMERKVEL